MVNQEYRSMINEFITQSLSSGEEVKMGFRNLSLFAFHETSDQDKIFADVNEGDTNVHTTSSGSIEEVVLKVENFLLGD